MKFKQECFFYKPCIHSLVQESVAQILKYLFTICALTNLSHYFSLKFFIVVCDYTALCKVFNF